ncbi:hypothetical protein, partial [Moorena sp. SIO3I6]|uniref:hypothetical protein n=1 Tax=Moorena sp. SIO3I6 TaxID=2607831 RepID=UPI0025D3E7CB
SADGTITVYRYFLATKVYQDRPLPANASCSRSVGFAESLSQGVSPKARRNIPRAPLMSRSRSVTKGQSICWLSIFDLIILLPPILTSSPVQLTVLLV